MGNDARLVVVVVRGRAVRLVVVFTPGWYTYTAAAAPPSAILAEVYTAHTTSLAIHGFVNDVSVEYVHATPRYTPTP